MNYENFAERIKPLYDFNTYKKPKADSKNLVRISVKKGEMTTHTIKKNKFSQLNSKRFYFPNGIISQDGKIRRQVHLWWKIWRKHNNSRWTGCGKTTFIQKLGKNKMFGEEILEVFWVLKINLSEEKEESIRASFEDQNVYFHYPSDLEDFNFLISDFTQKKSSYTGKNNVLGENLMVNKLIVMDDVSGLADKSEDFSNFLTVSRKYGFSCVYVFHTIYPGRQSWEMIMSQTHIFNFFPGSIYSGRISKTLAFFASRQKNGYVPNQQIWLNRLYFKISNSK